ncbi:MAG: hypothetical protein JNK82_14555 [Myxococcaceae bacterium]|nr:hypothetical protein [Myxococcaceae bacterium]
MRPLVLIAAFFASCTSQPSADAGQPAGGGETAGGGAAGGGNPTAGGGDSTAGGGSSTAGGGSSTAGGGATYDGGLAPWPGANAVATVDATATFSGNVSGATYAPGVLWVVQNSPGVLFRLVWNGAQSAWLPDSTNGWSTGKPLRYPSGTGDPDAEGVTLAEAGTSAVYVATERNNAVGATSRLSVLRYDVSGTSSPLIASHEWVVTADIPATGANAGLESITWVPDVDLVAKGFRDTRLAKAYAPADYPNHGGGLFVVGVESTGLLYLYALNHGDSTALRVASVSSGMPAIMGLEYDRETGYLWAHCDDTCSNRVSVLTVAGSGAFDVRARFLPPSTLPNVNHEGIAIAPEAECVANRKPYFWVDDADTAGSTVRGDSIPCGAFIP